MAWHSSSHRYPRLATLWLFSRERWLSLSIMASHSIMVLMLQVLELKEFPVFWLSGPKS